MSEIDRQSARFRYCLPPSLPEREKLGRKHAAPSAKFTPPLNEYSGPCWRCGKPDASRLTHVDGNLVWVCRKPSWPEFNQQEEFVASPLNRPRCWNCSPGFTCTKLACRNGKSSQQKSEGRHG
jgi:hypothetical protein